jgi:hypothetical protein
MVEAGRVLRGVLPELYGDHGWRAVDDELSLCLNQLDPGAAERIRAILESRPETAGWWWNWQRSEDHGGAVEPVRGADFVAGGGEVVAAPRFACPRGDFVWYRRLASVPVPVCRTHGVRLLPSGRAAR